MEGIQSRMTTQVTDTCTCTGAEGTDTSVISITEETAVLLHARFSADATAALNYDIEITDAESNVLYSREGIRLSEFDIFESIVLPEGNNTITLTNKASSGNVAVDITVDYSVF